MGTMECMREMSSRVSVPSGSQVFTPPELAQAMVNAVARTGVGSWLEPSSGTGVFLESLRACNFDPSSVTSLELDSSLNGKSAAFGKNYFGVEALQWIRRTPARFDAVIGNPPYAAISDLSNSLRKSALEVEDLSGRPIRASSNLWVAFVLSATRVLTEGGAMCFVLPASWDYADYARQLREELPLQFATFHTYRSAKPLFRGVSEGSVVILGAGFRKKHQYAARVKCTDIDALCGALADFRLTRRDLSRVLPPRIVQSDGASLRDFISLRLGGVTGDASYFCLTEQERLKHGLPKSSVRPIVSRARHLRWASVSSEQWNDLRANGEKVWLFRPTSVAQSLPAVRRYLRLELEAGGCDRNKFKIKSRTPWYLTPLPRSVDGFLSGMSMQGPRISFSDMSGLTATNTLYVVSFKRNLSDGARRNIALQLLGDKVTDQLLDVQRHYAGGLKKLEPSDILGLAIDLPTRDVSESRYRDAFEKLA
jgi:adenine-specific DNA-methyltransferase